ncbi:MAG TPA: hypothetical protein VKQ27_13210 [Acetobacteraceae bacterium]|nr:hypothetical protein [Acetobacteraceae bacterium]
MTISNETAEAQALQIILPLLGAVTAFAALIGIIAGTAIGIC